MINTINIPLKYARTGILACLKQEVKNHSKIANDGNIQNHQVSFLFDLEGNGGKYDKHHEPTKLIFTI